MMTVEQFYFTQKLLEVLSETIELQRQLRCSNLLIPLQVPSTYENLYDTVAKHYEQFRTSPHFYSMIDDDGYAYAVQEYVYGVKYGNIQNP